jgi:hypothetical protein
MRARGRAIAISVFATGAGANPSLDRPFDLNSGACLELVGA